MSEELWIEVCCCSVTQSCLTLCDPWTTACQASLSITNSRSLLSLMSIELVMPSNHLILCHPLLLLPSSFPASGSFPVSRLFAAGDWSFRTLASESVLPMNIQGWFPLGLTGLIALLSSSVQFSSVAQLCLTLCDPMDCSTPGFPVHHQLLEIAQTHVHWIGDAIQPSHPLSSPSPLALNLSQHQGLFQWVSSSHQVAKVLGFQLQHQSFQWIFRADFV